MNDPFQLHGNTILVTGASSGLGRAAAIELSARGASVIVNGRDQERLNATASQAGLGVDAVVAGDLTDGATRAAIVEALPELDGVFHCAGVGQVQPFKLVEEEALRSVMAANFEAPAMLTQALLRKRKLRKGASVVFVTSVAGLVGSAAHGSYSASKAALEGLARSLAVELGPRGIRVNCLAPGMIASRMAGEVEAVVSTGAMEEHARDYPLGLGREADVAAAAVYLLSDASRWVTGTCLVVDGGYTCH